MLWAHLAAIYQVSHGAQARSKKYYSIDKDTIVFLKILPTHSHTLAHNLQNTDSAVGLVATFY